MARENFTAGRIGAFSCPPGKPQAFLWDAKAPGLALRVTAGGARAFVFQSRLKHGGEVRITIGEPRRDDGGGAWSIGAAQAEARRLQGLIDQGKDPRLERTALIAQQAAEREAAKAERAKLEVTGLDAWAVYIEERREQWGRRNYVDHLRMAAAGGEARKRSREKLTLPGPLRPLLARPLAEIDVLAVEEWVSRETRARPARAALGFRLLRAFVNWCAEHPDYRGIVQPDACRGRRTREKLARPAARDDALQREQLAPWFAEVRKLSPVPGAYLQALLLTGARREELAGLRWIDVDFRWGSLRIRDKVEGERTIPLTPYVAGLLRELRARNATPPPVPRRLRADPEAAEARLRAWKPSPWVFASTTAKGGRIQDPRAAHVRALAAAGLPHVSLHGLRRSFGTLAEWVECPVGIVAQIQGHKPSAIAEKHYRVRPLDLLRRWHSEIERWILAEAGIEQPGAEERTLAITAVPAA
ncbi:MAG: integrase family protein [Rhodocyclaceae bacterium]|nr:integrase family protein [Rhodocyclaceae bacterium]